jgi:uncharacterized protein (DUF2236 family)
VWEHTTFRSDPVARMKRTGVAAMVSAYAARSAAERSIARIRSMHARVTGEVGGVPFAADDPDLLDWVQVTAAFGFLEAYAAYVEPISRPDRDAYYAQCAPGAALYGVVYPATSEAKVKARFDAMLPKLERSDIVFDFLKIVTRAPILPPPLRSVQQMMIRAGVELVPPNVRKLLGIGERWRLRSWEKRLVRLAGAASDRIPIPGSPPVEACRRLGLPTTWLHGSRKRLAHSI